MCCPPIPLHRPCPEWGQELKVALNSTCDEARGALKVNMPSPMPSSLHTWGLPLPSPRTPLLSLSSLLQNLLFSVCGLTICAAIICTLSAIVCCVQIFSLDLVHMVRREQGPSRQVWWERGVRAWWNWTCKVVATGLGSEPGALGHLRIFITGMFRTRGSEEDWMDGLKSR